MSIFSCRENSFRASRALDGHLSPAGRLLLALHQLMCAGCRAYARQIRSLASLLRRRNELDGGLLATGAGLTPGARERILAVLRAQDA